MEKATDARERMAQLQTACDELSPSEAHSLVEWLRKRYVVRTTTLRRTSRSVARVPKAPRIVQESIDRLVQQGKRGQLTARQRRELDEALDYLDQLTIVELARF